MRLALRPLRHLFGDLPADAFGLPELETVRNAYVAAGYVRDTCNAFTGIIRRAFRWGSRQRMVRPGIFAELADLEPLQPDRGTLAEGEGVPPVIVADVLAALPHLDAEAAKLIRFLGLTACRPEEGCIARPCDFRVHPAHGRIYRPASHKTEHKGVTRNVPISDAAWAFIEPLIAAAPADDAWLFLNPRARRLGRYDRNLLNREVVRACEVRWPNPHDAELERLAKAERCKTPWRGGGMTLADRRKRVRDDRPDLVEAAAEWFESHHWNPGQLRHTKLTQLRHVVGLEAAQLAAGHTTSAMTEHYAELTPDRFDVDEAMLRWSPGCDGSALLAELEAEADERERAKAAARMRLASNGRKAVAA